MLNIFQTSSLEKICPSTKLNATALNDRKILNGERFSYQIAYKDGWFSRYEYTVKSDIMDHIKIYDVENVPVTIPTDPGGLDDDNLISNEPGLFPDLLAIKKDNILKTACWYKSIWITVDEFVKPGTYEIEIVFKRIFDAGEDTYDEKNPATAKMTLYVSEKKLADQKLIFTQWFHTDCIAKVYNQEMFSKEHWEMIDKFIKMASENGINMLLTPIFTPPLDTEIGGERPTVQLVGIEKKDNEYSFEYSKLDKWIDICLKNGIKYFEMAHLFTQWGAEFTPKIIATENGKEKRIFGWDVKATDPSYDNFLSQFIPSLKDFLDKKGVLDNTYFHISDEPSDKNIGTYVLARDVAYKYLSGLKVMDALSEYEIYEKGYVDMPVASNDHMNHFIEHNVKNMWTYYCCAQFNGVSNRFIAMPSCRNRYIAYQLFKFNIEGFLQWGYNFYYSFLSREVIDPFKNTDASGRFPSGDPFSVYPGNDGPMPSIRLAVFYEAIQDLSALNMLKDKIGFEKTVEAVENYIGKSVEFDVCAKTATEVLNLRDLVNNLLEI